MESCEFTDDQGRTESNGGAQASVPVHLTEQRGGFREQARGKGTVFR